MSSRTRCIKPFEAVDWSRVKKSEQASTKSGRSVEDSQAAMGMGCTRVVERVCAAVGQMEEAPSKFEAALDVPGGGVLWALPALLSNGLLRHTRKYFSLPKGFYSLIQVFLLLAYMALQRIRTIEQLRYHSVGEFGNLLGLDRIPEVRTLREKVRVLSEPQPVQQWSARLSQEWMEADPQSAGILYVDGHVRTYHGSQTHLPRRYVARERLCLRGTTDYWVNDQLGRPFFVVNTPFTSGLLEMLRKEIVPRLLEEVPGQPGEVELEDNPNRCRFVMVFDREGYSPQFLREMWLLRIACQTYHKYPKEDWPRSEFRQYQVAMPHGEQAEMSLAERQAELSNGFGVREIRKLTDSGHQSSVLSTDYISDTSLIAAHMFSRWSQENFFKYMTHHFNIDGLVDYQMEPVDETARVVNPAYRTLEGQIKSKAGKLGRRFAEFGEITLQEGLDSKQIAEYEKKKGDLKEQVDFLQKDLAELKAQRKQTPKHVTVAQLPEEQRFTQLAPTRKQLIDTIRMISYRAETAMAILLRDVLARSDDARALLREIFTTEADLIPDEENGTLTVRLHHLTNHMSDEAARFLAKQLNASQTYYPATNLRLIYKLVSD
jgi:hypothetical protein